MKLPSSVEFDGDSYKVYVQSLGDYLFPNMGMDFIVQNAERHHQAYRLLQQCLISNRGCREFLSEYRDKEVVEKAWEEVLGCLSEKMNQRNPSFAIQVSEYIGIEKLDKRISGSLTFEEKTVWKDLCSYRYRKWRDIFLKSGV